VKIWKHLFILHKYFGWREPSGMAMRRSQHHSKQTPTYLPKKPYQWACLLQQGHQLSSFSVVTKGCNEAFSASLKTDSSIFAKGTRVDDLL
jgi:hypothetical protein